MEIIGAEISKDYPGFYHVPDVDQTLINRLGQVIDIRRGVCPLPRLDHLGYLSVNCAASTHHVHRMKALTFLPIPDEFIDLPKHLLLVNHKDGIKINNDLSNFEWVNHSGNILHAYQTGLRNDNKPVLIKDIRTGEIVRYYSLTAAAGKMKTTPASMLNHLSKKNRGKLSWHYYVVIYEGEDWPVIDASAIGKHRNGVAKQVIVKDLSTGQQYIFPSVGIAGIELGIPSGTIAMHIYRHGDKPRNGFVFMHLDEPRLLENLKTW